MPQPVPPAVECVLVRSQAEGEWRFAGELRAAEGVSGTYRLSVRSSAPGASSAANQSGTFTAAPGQIVRIGSARISAQAGTAPAATLEIRTADGTIACPIADKGLD